MADIVDQKTRSRMMSGIRSRDTKPEIQLRRSLHRSGFRFRLHRKELQGSPDIVLPRWKAAVFVHGCFWHRHESCRFATMPATRPEFWTAKFDKNVARDRRNIEALVSAGWRVAIVWECSIRLEPTTTMQRLESWLRGTSIRCAL
jgi:DNA mismatch endonuclease (patch repair protein)